jgi:hypothetical protein
VCHSDNANGDVPISTYKENFKGHISFVSINQESGAMDIAFQLKTPGVNFDLARSGKGKSHGWFFFSCYNTEQANTLLEVNASQKDKDFIMAVNWKKAEEYLKAGKGQKTTSSLCAQYIAMKHIQEHLQLKLKLRYWMWQNLKIFVILFHVQNRHTVVMLTQQANTLWVVVN